MRIRYYIVDTSYLLELFNVPGCSNPHSNTEVKKKFEDAIKSKSRLYVPLPCVFEIADHIANVKIGRKRSELAKKLFSTILSSLKESIPWILIPSPEPTTIANLFRSYAKNYVIQGIGLTDTTVISEASRLKKKYRSLGCSVHIWTKDINMKAFEPDKEDYPFTG
jgi:hypothetical protein